MNTLAGLLKRGPVVVPGAYDALSAILIEQAGFKAAYLSGAGLSAGFLGKPDIGLLTLDEVAGAAKRIAEVIRLPLLVDVDTGFGGPLNVKRTVQEMEAAGAAAIQIEDQVFPKRCGHLTGKSLIPAGQMAEKIRAAVAARRDKNFLIIARTDARGVKGMREALARAVAYRKAGADIIFPEALESAEEFKILGRQKGLGVLMANMTEFGRSPELAVSDLARLGYRLILFPMTVFRVAAFAMKNALRDLKITGNTGALKSRMQTRQELYQLIGYDEFNRREKSFLER